MKPGSALGSKIMFGTPFIQVASIMGPAATPRDIVTRLNLEVNRILQLPDMRARLDELGVRLSPMTPDQFTTFVRAENAKYRKVAQETGIKMD